MASERRVVRHAPVRRASARDAVRRRVTDVAITQRLTLEIPSKSGEPMVAGFFSNIFGEESNKIRDAARSYEKCLKERENILRSFRDMAIREINFTYPDAIFVISTFTDKFLAFSKSRGAVLHGSFDDKSYAIDLVENKSDLQEYTAVINRFRMRVRKRKRVAIERDSPFSRESNFEKTSRVTDIFITLLASDEYLVESLGRMMRY